MLLWSIEGAIHLEKCKGRNDPRPSQPGRKDPPVVTGAQAKGTTLGLTVNEEMDAGSKRMTSKGWCATLVSIL
jgi:hypothetical protein